MDFSGTIPSFTKVADFRIESEAYAINHFYTFPKVAFSESTTLGFPKVDSTIPKTGAVLGSKSYFWKRFLK